MAISKRNLPKIKEIVKLLSEKYDVSYFEEAKLEVGIKHVALTFPFDLTFWTCDVDQFLEYTTPQELNTLYKVNENTVRTANYRQTLISYTRPHDFIATSNPIYEDDNLAVSIIDRPFYIGLIAVKEKLCIDNYDFFPTSNNEAIELKYKRKTYLTPEDEDKLIEQILYLLSIKFQHAVRIVGFYKGAEKEIDFYTIQKNEFTGQLIAFSPAMQIYRQAISVEDSALKFLYFYKIIEYFSPIVAKKHAYEKLNQKLDALSATSRDHRYLDSIFQLTRKYDKSVRDAELAKTVLRECIDIQEGIHYLPERVKETLRREAKLQDVNNIDEDKLPSVISVISKVLYSTRNNFVHAKSNYELTGYECREEDMEDLNEYISNVCACLIQWNGRQHPNFRT